VAKVGLVDTLRETRPTVSFGAWFTSTEGSIMRIRGVGIVWELVTRNEANSVIWGLVYTNRGSGHRLGPRLCESGVFA